MEAILKIFIRLILTSVLIYFIYGETGPVTAFAFFLAAIKDEAMAYWMRHAQGCFEQLKI
jgi:hypothetical protein